MEKIGSTLTTIDNSLDTKRKRHIAGGILLSVAFLFAGLALTVMSLRAEENMLWIQK